MQVFHDDGRMTSAPGAPTAEQVDAAMDGFGWFISLAVEGIADTVHRESVTWLQIRVLELVALRPGVTVSGIARATGVAVSSASRTCDRLLAAGLVDRRRSTSDRRRVELVVTDRALEILAGLSVHRRHRIAETLAVLTSEERAHLTQGLQALCGADTVERTTFA